MLLQEEYYINMMKLFEIMKNMFNYLIIFLDNSFEKLLLIKENRKTLMCEHYLHDLNKFQFIYRNAPIKIKLLNISLMPNL